VTRARKRWCLAPLLGLALVGCDRATPAVDGGPTAVDAGTPRVDAGPPPPNAFFGPLRFLSAGEIEAIDPSTLPAGRNPARDPILVRVLRAFDGDTVEVSNLPEERNRIRFIGVDTPETSDPPECFGDEATVFTEQLEGQLVWLTFDTELLDRFGRTLAYVHIGDGEADFWERQLLRRGFGTVLSIAPNTTFRSVFEGDQQAAEAASVGLWERCLD
jgi:endonuclease YncB( thermonuclease family)